MNISGHIQILAALPQEYKPFQKHFHRKWRLRSRTPYRHYECTMGDRHFRLTETGMGPRAILGALRWVLSAHPRPDLLVSFGYAGSLSAKLQVGDVCLVDRVFRLDWPRSKEVTCGGGYATHYMEDVKRLASSMGVKPASLLTVKAPVPKAHLRTLAGGADLLLDMETFYAAAAAAEHRIPLLCLRGVSDGPRDDIQLDPALMVDHRGRLSPLRVFLQISKRPSLLPFVFKSWKDSSLASKALATTLADFLGLPHTALQNLWAENHEAPPPHGGMT